MSEKPAQRRGAEDAALNDSVARPAAFRHHNAIKVRDMNKALSSKRIRAAIRRASCHGRVYTSHTVR
jgi:hypothetical protein